MNRLRRRAQRDDRGIILVLVAFGMVAMLTMAAIVIDLGHAWASKRGDQSAADLAALAAGFFLSGRGSSGIVPNAFEACQAAITSVETNIDSFTPALSAADKATACAAFPTNTASGCTSTTSATDTAGITRGEYTLVIRYPVPDSDIADSRFTGGTGADDGTNRCDRMRVTLTHKNPTFFSSAVGVENVTTKGSAVVRGNTTRVGQGVAALLLLERVGCGTLQTSGGASSGSGVTVQASSSTNPGVIQSDSAGIVGGVAPVPCTTNTNADGYVIYGTALPSAGGGGASITAGASSNGSAGVIAL